MSSLWQKLCPLSVLPARPEQASHVIIVVFLYRCRLRTCNRTMIFSPRKSSNHPSWSTRIVRFIMLQRWSESKLSVSVFPILYPDDALGENSCIVNGFIVAITCGHVTMRMIFTLIIFIDTSDSCYCCDSNTRFDENHNDDDPILWGLMKFTR